MTRKSAALAIRPARSELVSENAGLPGRLIRGGIRLVAKGEVPHMSWVPVDRIPRTHREFVRGMVDEIGTELGLPYVTVRYFTPAPPGSSGDFTSIEAPFDDAIVGGLTIDDPFDPVRPIIGLLARARGEMVVGIIAHEMRHVKQLVTLSQLNDPRWREADAEAWAGAWVSRRLDS